jgi:hypothetical protein
MEQSHPLSHGAIIRVVLEDKVINSNTARINSSSFIGQHPDYLGADVHTEKTSHIIRRRGSFHLGNFTGVL